MEAPPRQQLPPGFRFHPTDEELVVQYLRRKALARPLPAAVIPVVRAAALPDPWDLPGAREGEAAYFFSQRQAPTRGGGGRRRRAASGYWKATGKEKPVFVQLPGPSESGSGKRLLVGVKRALAFHRGKGKASLTRTDWVMHEYRLAAAPRDSQQSCEWVVCRVSLKNRARRSAAGDHHQTSSPSSSCVTDTCHATDNQEVSSSINQYDGSSILELHASGGGTVARPRARGLPAVHGPRHGARAILRRQLRRVRGCWRT